jgi:hypothetical protein
MMTVTWTQWQHPWSTPFFFVQTHSNVTRYGCRHTVKMQEDILQVLRDDLQKKRMKDKHIDLPNE